MSFVYMILQTKFCLEEALPCLPLYILCFVLILLLLLWKWPLLGRRFLGFLSPRKSMLPYKSVFESFCFENWLSYSTISLATLPRFETPVSSYFLVENRLRQSAQGSKRKNYFNLCCWSVHGKLSKWKELYPREKWLQPPNSLRNFLLPKNLKISFTFTTSCATC